MERWDPEKEKEVKTERRRKLAADYRRTMTDYLRMYGYEEIDEPDTFFVFVNEENGLTIKVYKYRDQHAWRYRLEFFDGEEKVHTEDPVKRDHVGNIIIDTEGMLLKERMRKGFTQRTEQSLDPQS
ncbi:hypothetical protein ACFL3T_03310 [Patescibacteria group bacterium]